MTNPNDLVAKVAELYAWIDGELQSHPALAGQCQGCGQCCDFEAYDHRLFVTTPELHYFRHHLGRRPVRPMTGGVCPYQVEKCCTIRSFRFAGCRIFCSHGDPEYQADLTERVLVKLKALCVAFELPYRYMDLRTALDCLQNEDAYGSSVSPDPLPIGRHPCTEVAPATPPHGGRVNLDGYGATPEASRSPLP